MNALENQALDIQWEQIYGAWYFYINGLNFFFFLGGNHSVCSDAGSYRIERLS